MPTLPVDRKLGRRLFLFATVGSGAAVVASDVPQTKTITQASVPDDPNAPKEQPGTVAPSSPFAAPIEFIGAEATFRIRPFPLSQVRLLPSAFLNVQEANRALLRRYPADRLLHNFRVNAGLPSSAQPLGGWEKPDCQLRGHFVGHYLSA